MPDYKVEILFARFWHLVGAQQVFIEYMNANEDVPGPNPCKVTGL